MGALEQNTTLIYGLHLRESANDGSDFGNGATDYRIAFIGEDGLWHFKDSAGTVTTPGGIPATLFDAKGDLIAASAADTAARLPIGTNGHVLTADSGEATGMKWAAGAGAASLQSARYIRSSANYTITGAGSNSFADLDGTNMSFTFTTGARRVLLGFTGTAACSSNAGQIRLTFTVDGTNQGGSAGGFLAVDQHATAAESWNISMTYLTDVLSAASHTFKVQWSQSNTAHTSTMFGTDPTCTFYAVELYA